MPPASLRIRRHSPPPASDRPSLDCGRAFLNLLTPPPSTETSDILSTSRTQVSVEHVVSEIKLFRNGVASLCNSTDRLVIPNVPDHICNALEDYFLDVHLHLTHRIDTHSLTVRRRRPTEVHECVGEFFSSQEPVLQEWIQLHHPTARIDAFGSATQHLRDGGRMEPDESFYISTSGDLPIAPAVVIEAGCLEKHSESREDVDDWLLRGRSRDSLCDYCLVHPESSGRYAVDWRVGNLRAITRF